MSSESFTAELIEEFRRTSRERLERITVTWVKLETDPGDDAALEELRRELHSLKGEAKMLGFVEASRLAHRAEELVLQARERGFADAESVGDLLLAASDKLDELVQRTPGNAGDPAALESLLRRFDALSKGAAAPAARRAPSRERAAAVEAAGEAETVAPQREDALGDTVRVDAALVSWLASAAGESIVAFGRHERTLERLASLVEEAGSYLAVLEAGAAGSTAVTNLRRVQRQLASLVDAHRQRVHEDALEAREVEHRTRQLRLVPVRGLFERYVRAVRDLAREQKKVVRLDLDDGGVAVDKVIVDRLAEPLLHLVRNSVDHGIESAKERARAGKPAEAHVRLLAQQREGVVRVTVADDGRGIDLARVRARGVELGMVDAAASLGEDEVLALLFRPGFSTRKEVSELSGRGVGLHVVAHQARLLGGSVRVLNEPGRGARFEIETPVTVALSRVLVVEVGEALYALPAANVRAVSAVDERALQLVDGRPSLPVGDGFAPLADLGILLGAAGQERGDRAVILGQDGRLQALRVSSWRSEAEVIIKPLGPLVADAALVAGGCILEDGSLALVLDVPELLARARGGADAPRESLQGPRATAARRRVLVAEDSLITRQLVMHSLATLGYEVLEASNGRAALGIVEQTSVDLVLTDIDMPEMDGIELIRALRREPGRRNLPVVVLSSRGSEEDKRRAAEVGADAYLVKSEFSEETLREVLARRLGR